MRGYSPIHGRENGGNLNDQEYFIQLPSGFSVSNFKQGMCPSNALCQQAEEFTHDTGETKKKCGIEGMFTRDM